MECIISNTTQTTAEKLEHDHFVTQKLTEAEEYAKRPDAIRYSHKDFCEKARAELYCKQQYIDSTNAVQ